MDRSLVRPDVAGLRALAHPARLRMLGLLRHEGPATATTLALQLGLNTGSTSYHLRQLEKHGFVEEDTERGNARDRWWRAAHTTTQTSSSDMTTPEEHDTYDAYIHAAAVVQNERHERALEERRLLPAAWRDIGDLSDWTIRLTPGRAEALIEAIHELVDGLAEDDADTPEAAPFTVNLRGFVRPGSLDVVPES